MKILLAFDSFKGCLPATDVCGEVASALRASQPGVEVVELPLSDGGEGMVACVSRLRNVRIVSLSAHGPLMQPVEATYALSTDGLTAYMEMAATSGLTLVPEGLRDPMKATTYGVGEMIFDARQRGVKHIVIGLGGSATSDAGRGMIEALNQLEAMYERTEQWTEEPPRITVACDVTNPLYGPNGAAYVFAPQKGATPEQVRELDNRFREYVQIAERVGLTNADVIARHPGAGAAGGLGFALMAFLGAELKSGIDTLLDIAHFDELLSDADLVITGEGCSDRQTLMGKVPYGVLQRARQLDVPVHLLSGGIQDSADLLAAGFASVRSINQGDNRPLSILIQPDVARENLRRSITSYIFPINNDPRNR